MVPNKKQVIFLLILFIIVIMLSVMILNEFFNSYKKISELNINLKRVALSNDVLEYVVKSAGNVQDYILYKDQKHLDDFRRNISLTIKNELELYNIMAPSKKQNLEELIEYSKAYSSFIEKEVVPVILAKHDNTNDVKYIQLNNKEFVLDLHKKAGNIAGVNRSDIEDHFKKEIMNNSVKVTAMLMILISALALLIWEIFAIIKPLLIRHFYLGMLADQVKTPVLIVDRGGVVKDLNRPAQDLLDISRQGILHKNISEIAVQFPHLQKVTQPLYNVIIQKKELKKHIFTYQHAGRKIDLVADYIPIFVFNRLSGAMMIASPAEAHKDKNVLLDTLEAERKRISIEIHDWIGRHMSTMIHSLDYILRLNKDNGRDSLKDNLLALRAHCQNAAIEMRGIMNDIHPYLIDKVGLISALESYISTFERLNSIKVYIMYQDRSLRVKKKDEIMIYRIIQEALTNVAKHAKATEVDIEFTVYHDTLKIEVADNGGDAGDFTAGKGLWGMRERANLIGGDIVFSHTGSGFCVTLTVPILPGGQQNEQN